MIVNSSYHLNYTLNRSSLDILPSTSLPLLCGKINYGFIRLRWRKAERIGIFFLLYQTCTIIPHVPLWILRSETTGTIFSVNKRISRYSAAMGFARLLLLCLFVSCATLLQKDGEPKVIYFSSYNIYLHQNVALYLVIIVFEYYNYWWSWINETWKMSIKFWVFFWKLWIFRWCAKFKFLCIARGRRINNNSNKAGLTTLGAFIVLKYGRKKGLEQILSPWLWSFQNPQSQETKEWSSQGPYDVAHVHQVQYLWRVSFHYY